MPQTNIQTTFYLDSKDYKKLIVSALDSQIKPSVSNVLKLLIEKASQDELTEILSR